MSEFIAKVILEPWQFADSMGWDYGRIVDYVAELDREVGDTVFTEQLYARLGDALREELESNG